MTRLRPLAAMALTLVAGTALADDIYDRDGKRIGTVEQNRVRPGRQLDVLDRDGKRVGTIERNAIRPDRQMDILDKSGRRVGTIERRRK